MAQKTLVLIMVCVCLFFPGLAAAQTADSPQDITQKFYDWYLQEEEQNPFWEQLYQGSPYLTAGMIQHLDDLHDAALHYDPVICASNLPSEIRAEEISATDTGAVVLLHIYIAENPVSGEITVLLDQSEGSWKISDIRCEDLITPAGVVQNFYDTYTNHEGNPFLDGVYRDFERITDDLVAQLDSLQTGTGIMQDPIFCGPEIPFGSFTDELWMTDTAASVIVEEIIGNGVVRNITVGLTRQNDAWYIDNINCQTTPEEKVLNFYNRYLLFTRYNREHGIDRDVTSDISFFWLHYVTPELENDLRSQLTSGDRAVDPVLCAPDLPQTIITLPGENPDEVRVQGTFTRGTTPIDLATVTMEEKYAEWIISSLTCLTR